MIFISVTCWILLVGAIVGLLYLFFTEMERKPAIACFAVIILCIICLILLRNPPTKTVESVTSQQIIKISSDGDTTVSNIFIATYDGDEILQTTDPRIKKGDKVWIIDSHAYLEFD